MTVVKHIADACRGFFPDGVITGAEQIHNGHINLTYRVGVDGRDYILQRINTSIFRDPDSLINNISLVTEHLRRREQIDYKPLYDKLMGQRNQIKELK